MMRLLSVIEDIRKPLGILAFFAWILAVQLIGLGVFTKGFFLTRVELGRQSVCDIDSLLDKEELEHLSQPGRQRSGAHHDTLDTKGCWLPPRFKRVVWVVIDALRFDFAAYVPDEGKSAEGDRFDRAHRSGAKHYLNHLPVIHEALNGAAISGSEFEGSGGVLFQFEADPPTVTMQRLKGLTTGGLPTFIDFRDNFHSPEIAEDNWVAQIKSRAERRARKHGGSSNKSGGRDGGGELVFMGDDTWVSLYPTYFSRSFPFPSFNTRDLHTVDDGVLDHLSNELAKEDWEVLVAHFLGVDHVGHTFGPASQAMEDKLDQMNQALRTVFKSVDEETLVFVLGDHGMTEDGNHGGATPEETGAALLIWSRSRERLLGHSLSSSSKPGDKEIRDARYNIDESGAASIRGGGLWKELMADGGDPGRLYPSSRKVAQIDLVPTVSLLLGTPIPFGNLGGIIPEVFMGSYVSDSEGSLAGSEGEKRRKEQYSETSKDGPHYYERLCDALLVNSLQVWRYLSEYAKVASIPGRDMFELKALLSDARSDHAAWIRRWKRSAGTREITAEGVDALRRVCDGYRHFLNSSIGLGRSLWTQYDTGLMWWGLGVLLLATLVLCMRIIATEAESAVAKAMGESQARIFSGDIAGRTAGGSLAYMSSWRAGYHGMFWGVVGATGAFIGDTIFGPSSLHELLVKAVSCSCLGMCWYYVQAVQAHWSRLSIHCKHSSHEASTQFGGGGNNAGTGTWASSFDKARRTMAPATLAPIVIAALYCAGLFSNSFIEGEDQLHRFLGGSSLLALAAVLSLPTSSCGTVVVSGSPAVAGKTRGVSGFAEAHLPGLDVQRTMREPAVYAIFAAFCLRAASAAQDSSPGVIGLAPGVSFGVFRSLAPLMGLWILCCIACGGRDAVARIAGRAAGLRRSRQDALVPKDSWWSNAQLAWVFHASLQALSFFAISAHWADEAMRATASSASGSESVGDGGGGDPSDQVSVVDEGLLFGLLPPARLFFPRMVYAVCFMGLFMAAVLPYRGERSACVGGKSAHVDTAKNAVRLAVDHVRSPRSRNEGGSAGVVAATAATVTTHLLPVVVMLLGAGSPAVILPMAVACACLSKSVSMAAKTSFATVPLGAISVVWSIVGRAVFFLTGHHNQFSRLQYSAAFVGFEEFNFQVGGVLLFINTFGTEIIAAFTLPLVAAAAVPSTPVTSGLGSRETGGDGVAGKCPGNVGASVSSIDPMGYARAGVGGDENETLSLRERTAKALWDRDSVSQHSIVGSPKRDDTEGEQRGRNERIYETISSFTYILERLSGLTLLLSAIRTLLSAANVSVQRGHLMLWAVFAPKFIFDATMQAVSGAAAVVVWAVVTASLAGLASRQRKNSGLQHVRRER